MLLLASEVVSVLAMSDVRPAVVFLVSTAAVAVPEAVVVLVAAVEVVAVVGTLGVLAAAVLLVSFAEVDDEVALLVRSRVVAGFDVTTLGVVVAEKVL